MLYPKRFNCSGANAMNTSERKLTILEKSIRTVCQASLATGTMLITYAIYLISGGTIEAILMFLPGALALGGGLVIRKASGVHLA